MFSSFACLSQPANGPLKHLSVSSHLVCTTDSWFDCGVPLTKSILLSIQWATTVWYRQSCVLMQRLCRQLLHQLHAVHLGRRNFWLALRCERPRCGLFDLSWRRRVSSSRSKWTCNHWWDQYVPAVLIVPANFCSYLLWWAGRVYLRLRLYFQIDWWRGMRLSLHLGLSMYYQLNSMRPKSWLSHLRLPWLSSSRQSWMWGTTRFHHVL